MKFLSAFRFLCVAVGVMTLLSACRTSSTSVTQTDAVPVVRLSDEDQRRFDYYFLEATRLKLRGDYAPAYEMIRHCLAIHPQSSSALYEQAQYLLMLKQEEKATRSLEAAVRLAPDNYWYSQALCNFYLQSNDTTGKARRLLESMSIRFPNKPDVLYTLMGLYNRNGEYSRVIDVLNRLEQKLGKSEQLSMEKFRMYLQLQDMKNAFREMESLVAEYPKDPRYKVVLGDIYLENKKPEQAYRLYQEALTDEPDNALALYSLANYYDEMGMEEQYKHQLDTLLMTGHFSENSPVFSPDGRTLYYTTALQQHYPTGFREQKYSLCRIGFDPENGCYGTQVDTLFNAFKEGKSLSWPRPSYDGKYVMVTLADYGYFSIWHKESDLWLLEVATGRMFPLEGANSPDADSYHNWSTGSHWFVFTSRRENGLYSLLYLSCVDGEGRATKPFLLPQKNPKAYYLNSVYSYNTPDFTSRPVELDSRKAARAIESEERVPVQVR